MANSTLLDVSGVTVRHKGLTLLDDITFSVEPGETFVLLGASGAGKSLLIDAIAGNIPHDGVVAFNPAMDKAQRTFSYDVFATLTLLKVREVLKLIETIYQAPRNQDIIDRFQIGAMLDRPFRVLSKGERKRIGVYAALFSDPQIAILDEPTDGMDPILRDVFWDIVNHRQGTTLLTTHIWDEAQNHHDRIALIAGGRLLAPPAPLAGLLRLVEFSGKVITSDLREPEAGHVSLINDRRRFFYFRNDAERDLVAWASASGGGYSVLPVDLTDIYLLLGANPSPSSSKEEVR